MAAGSGAARSPSYRIRRTGRLTATPWLGAETRPSGQYVLVLGNQPHEGPATSGFAVQNFSADHVGTT